MSRRSRAPRSSWLAAVVPRLVARRSYERDDLLERLTEKSDRFARTFVASGTYGFIPGVPSAYTQPLYGFFLVRHLLGRPAATGSRRR